GHDLGQVLNRIGIGVAAHLMGRSKPFRGSGVLFPPPHLDMDQALRRQQLRVLVDGCVEGSIAVWPEIVEPSSVQMLGHHLSEQEESLLELYRRQRLTVCGGNCEERPVTAVHSNPFQEHTRRSLPGMQVVYASFPIYARLRREVCRGVALDV